MESETPQVEQRTQTRGRAGRVLVGALLLSTAGWWVVYLVGVNWWIGDVLLNGSVYLGVMLAACSLVRLAAVRSWGSVGVAVVCLSVLLMCMNGRRVLPSSWVGGGDAVSVDAGQVRVVGLNLLMSNEDPEGLMWFLETLNDDVVVLVEPQWDVFARLMDRNDPLNQYPHRELRRREGLTTSPMMILSRWGLERDTGVGESVGVSVVVDRPEEYGGRFRVAGVYAHSPRNGARWAMGNGVVEGYVDALRGLGVADGLPLVMVGDLNGGPMTGRDRALRDGLGVARVSALFDPRSTFPAKMSMFGLLIDDIWVDGSVDGVSWSTVVIPGSDHRGVRGVLVIGGGPDP